VIEDEVIEDEVIEDEPHLARNRSTRSKAMSAFIACVVARHSRVVRERQG
jgi:hypothetical protein